MRDRFEILGLCLFCVGILYSCSEDISPAPEVLTPSELDTISFEHSMKGWELYSWPTEEGWSFSLMTGTNTIKNYEVVVNQDVVVTGMRSLEDLMKRMPPGEEIIWMSASWLEQIWMTSHYNLKVPSQEIVLEFEEICLKHDLILTLTSI